MTANEAKKPEGEGEDAKSKKGSDPGSDNEEAKEEAKAEQYDPDREEAEEEDVITAPNAIVRVKIPKSLPEP